MEGTGVVKLLLCVCVCVCAGWALVTLLALEALSSLSLEAFGLAGLELLDCNMKKSRGKDKKTRVPPGARETKIQRSEVGAH